MGAINNCPHTKTQTPKHLHTQKIERAIGLPVEIFADAALSGKLMIFCIEDNFFFRLNNHAFEYFKMTNI